MISDDDFVVGPNPGAADLLARWNSDGWLHETTSWVMAALEAARIKPSGPIDRVHTKFWSSVLRVPTSTGAAWFKECNPGQGFEVTLTAVLAQLEPHAFCKPIAVDAARHRMLIHDAGQPLDDRGALRDMLSAFASVQQRLIPHEQHLLDAGLPTFRTAHSAAYVEAVATVLAQLPRWHPQHVSTETHTRIMDGLPVVATLAQLADSAGVPNSFQHNDLSPPNTTRDERGQHRWFDLGDSFWSHPFAVLQLPLAMASRTWPWGPELSDPASEAAVRAYLSGWERHGSVDDLLPVAHAAMRLAQLHRCESWRRLLANVNTVPEKPPRLSDFLLQVTDTP